MASLGANLISTPINTVTREQLKVLIRNNVLNESIEMMSDCDTMETDSPMNKRTSLQPITKKLFHSPIPDQSPNRYKYSRTNHNNLEKSKKCRKRKQTLLPDSCEKIKKAFVKDFEQEGYSPEIRGGMRKKVLISLFHNKEYSMDMS